MIARHSPAVAALTTFVSLVACGPVITGESASVVSPPPIPQDSEPTPAPGQLDSDELRARHEIDRVMRQVSRMRRLPALGSVDGRVIDRPTMLRQVKEQVRTQVPMDAIKGESAFLSSFGFIPQDYDYESGVYSLIESQLAGYYDPDRKSMFLMGDLSGAESEVTLAHELVHALQDQHYSLGPRLKYRKDANDEQAAIHCLAEGDATSLMLDFTLRDGHISATSIPDDTLRLEILSSMALSPEMAAFPRVLRDSLVAPYVDGVLFVHALRRRGGWQLVDDMWKNPPTTTEQVLHADKLDTREPAEVVALPVPPGEGSWSAIHSDVYGEQGLRIAFEEWMPRRVAVAAAAGWGGDRLAVFLDRDSDSTVAAWRLRFDAPGEGEAKEAFEAIASGWGKQPANTTLCRSLDGRALAAARKGRDVVLVAGPLSEAVSTHAASTCARQTAWALRILAQP